MICSELSYFFPKSVAFDLSSNAPSNEVYFCKRESQAKYAEIGSAEFLRKVKHSHYDQILIYIHGFNNLPEDDIFKNSKLLQEYFDIHKNNNILVIPIIWPCDNDFGVVQDYWDDQIAADMSGFSIQRALSFFYFHVNDGDGPCYKFINILAHSMGNRVLRQSLNCWKKYLSSGSMPKIFRNIFMLAPDIVNESLEFGNDGEIISQASRNVVVYYAGDDLALRASKILNLGNRIASRRLGHSGPESLDNLPKNIYSVDCDNINNSYDSPKGHTYFLPQKNPNENNAVLEHICGMLDHGRFSNDGSIKNIIL